MLLVFLTIFLQTSLGQDDTFLAYIFEEDHTTVEGALCTIFRDGSTPVEETWSDFAGVCNFTEMIFGGEDGDIIRVRDLLPPETGYPTSNAPHAQISLKIWDEFVPIAVPFLPIPPPGEIIIFFSWTGATFWEEDASGEELDFDLHLFIESDGFNCSHIASRANRICHGTNARYCNGVARMEKDDGTGIDSILTTESMGLEIMRIVDTNPGRYRFQAYALDLGHVTFHLNDADVIYLGMVFGSRIGFAGNAGSSAQVVPQSIMSYNPDTALTDGNLRWWHAFTIDVVAPTDSTTNCQRTVDIWKVNHFCNDCAPENLADTTALADSPEGELVNAQNWADCLWAITQSSCEAYVPPTFERRAVAKSYGDPHFKTNDKFGFDIYDSGTYNYFRSAEKKVDIQARLRYLPPNDLTYNGQVLIKVEEHTFEFTDGSDGELIALYIGKHNLATTGRKSFGGDIFKHFADVTKGPDGEWNFSFYFYWGALEVTVVSMKLPPSYSKRTFDFRGVVVDEPFLGLTTGALGDFNNNPFDDFKKDGVNYAGEKDERGGLFKWAEQWLVTSSGGTLPGLLEQTESLFSPYFDWLASQDPGYTTRPPRPTVDLILAAAAAAACTSLYDAAALPFEYNACVVDASIPGGPEYVLSSPIYRTCTDDCNNHGNCQAGDSCFCAPSFTGRWCETAICVCRNGGTCLPTGFCSCAAGWTGAHCDLTPDCSNLDDCNAGTCIEDNLCECSDGVAGPNCGVGYFKADHCIIQQNPFDNNMTCFGSCDGQHICGKLPDHPYSCVCMEDLTQTDPGHCSTASDCAVSANQEFVKCDFQHCYCKNPLNTCTGLDCSSCTGCTSDTDCVGNPVLVECLENKCGCVYDGPCIANGCNGCLHQLHLTITPTGRSVATGPWTVSSLPTVQARDGFPNVLLQEDSFSETVDIPAGWTALQISEALSAALQLNSDFTSICDSEWTGSEWIVRCSPLEGSVVLDFNGVDAQRLEDYEFNGASFKTTGFCIRRDDCLGAHVELVGCMDNQCVCIFGEDTCTDTDCSECKGCVTGHVDCSFEKGPSACLDGVCSCTIDGTCVDIDCSECVHPPYDPPTDYWCGVDGEFGTFKGHLLNNRYDVEEYIDCCLLCRADEKCDAFSFDGIPPKVCKYYDVGAKPLIRPGYLKGWHHGKLRHPDP